VTAPSAPPKEGGGEVSAKLVMQLRAATGLPMMKCKEALEACGGDFEKAVDWLRKKGLETAAKKADRVMKEGRVALKVSPDGTTAAMVEVDCETEPVAGSPDFKGFADAVLQNVFDHAKGKKGEIPAAEVLAWPQGAKGETVETTLKALIAKITENMAVSRAAAFSGAQRIGSYLHFNAKVGVLMELAGDAAALKHEATSSFLNELGQHVAFAKPASVSRDDVSKELVDKEMEIYREQAKQDPKLAGKPAPMVDKILVGKLDKFYASKCLLEQPWVRDDKLTVQAALDAAAKKAGGAMKVVRFAFFKVGPA
jgi:elongation factor Ts